MNEWEGGMEGMPEEQSEQTASPEVDYSEQLQVISGDLKYLRDYIETNQDSFPNYSQDLFDMKTILNEINGKLVVPDESNRSADSDALSLISADISEMKEILLQSNVQSQSLYNVSISAMCGIGILIGVVCSLIFSNFVRH